MQYFGIKTPGGTIWWISDSEHNAWMSFFQYPSNKHELMAHRLPIDESIRAYRSIGYECVELMIAEKSQKDVKIDFYPIHSGD